MALDEHRGYLLADISIFKCIFNWFLCFFGNIYVLNIKYYVFF